MSKIIIDLEQLKKTNPVKDKQSPAEILNKNKDNNDNKSSDLGNPLLQESKEKFAEIIGLLVHRLFDKNQEDFSIVGYPDDVNAFVNVIKMEKKYIEQISHYGVNDLRTWKVKAKLRQQIIQFEDRTGIEWPLPI
jgi:ethanolamine ammonia-lyase large subunit